MPGEPEDMDDNNIEQDEELVLETEADDDGDEHQGVEGDEQDIVLEGEEPVDEADETPVVRKLRKMLREEQKKNRTLAVTPAQPVKREVGPRPTMEDTDVDWDQDKFAEKMTGWLQEKHAAEQADKEAEKANEQRNVAWAAQLTKYEQAKAKLAVPGKEEAEEEALSKLSQVQQAIIVKHPNSAAIMIALGKYPKRLETASAISDPVDFTYAIGDIARELKVTARRKAPEPEGIVRGGAPLSATVDKYRERLEKEADRTGDRSKLVAYNRDQKQAKK